MQQHQPRRGPRLGPSNSAANAVPNQPPSNSPEAPADDTINAVRRQVNIQLNDLDELEGQRLSAPAPRNRSQEHSNQQQQQQQHLQRTLAETTAAPIPNAPTRNENDEVDSDEEEMEDGEEENSSEIELTIRSSPGIPAPAAAFTPATTGGGGGRGGGSCSSSGWRPQHQSNRDLRSWRVFRNPSGGGLQPSSLDGRAAPSSKRRQRDNRHRRNSTSGAPSSFNSNTFLGGHICKPTAFSRVSERNSVGLGTGLRDLAITQLRQIHQLLEAAPQVDVVRLPKALFDRELTGECYLTAIVGVAKSTSVKSSSSGQSSQLKATSGRRRAASWAAMGKAGYR